MKNTINQLLKLKDYAAELGKKCEIHLHEEDSHFVRLANSGISLITSEKLSKLGVSCYDGRKNSYAESILNIEDFEKMKSLVDKAVEMVEYASDLSYDPSFPVFNEISIEENGFDSRLAEMSNEDILNYIREASSGLETEDIVLSGNFSKGETRLYSLSTANDNYAVWRNSDAQVTLVLSSVKEKWEINAEQSANRLEDLNPKKLQERLKILLSFYTKQKGEPVPVGKYKLVLGPAAIAEYLGFLSYCGSDGKTMELGSGIYTEDVVGRKVLSDKFTLFDDPNCYQAFAQQTDAYGIKRSKKALYEKGVHKGFLWSQQAADEYGKEPSGIELNNISLSMEGGDMDISSLDELLKMPRDRDILYVPYLHYTGLVNPSEGLITGTTRFGALLLKKDGSVVCPFNVRITEKLEDVFGNKLVWISKNTESYNMSESYGRRQPVARIVPSLMMIEDVTLELNNSSY